MTDVVEPTNEEVIVDFGVIFEGSEILDEIKDKVKLMFEAALAVKVDEEVKTLQETYAAKFETQLDEVKQELVTQIDSFLNYAVEEWVTENKLAIESGLRTEIAENFIESLKTVFEENYIDVPEDKYDLVAEMEQDAADMKIKMDEEIAKNIALKSTIDNLIKESVIAEMGKELAATDMDKLKTLAESVEFDSEQNFKEKLLTLKENFFKKPVPATTQLDESTDVNTVVVDAGVKGYVDFFNKKFK